MTRYPKPQCSRNHKDERTPIVARPDLRQDLRSRQSDTDVPGWFMVYEGWLGPGFGLRYGDSSLCLGIT